MAQTIFKRVEKKYLLDEETYQKFRERIAHMTKPDAFSESSIYNVYFDTPDYRLIRRSLEKPVYKEKLRLRTYQVPKKDSPSFIEIKKKYDGVVYKRRIELPYETSVRYLTGRAKLENPTQISREIDYFKSLYKGLRPMMAISYDRIALAGVNDPELRITFDTNIRYRKEQLSLMNGNMGRDILKKGQHLMEIKVAGAFNLELAHILNELDIRQVSFSKYGTAYQMELQKSRVAARTPRVRSSVPQRQQVAYA